MNNMNNMNGMQNMNNMQNIQKMMEMLNNMKTNKIFNPSKIDKSSKRTLINNNINQSRVGLYKNLAKYDSISVGYTSCDPGKADSICDVKVIYEHSLDIAEQYADIGTNNFTRFNKMNPVILNVIGKDFTGDSFETSEDMRDEMINIRTTFCDNPKKNNIFPLKDNHCVHTPLVNVIRPKDPSTNLPWPQCYRVGLISSAPIPQTSVVKKMSSCDFLKTCTIIETVFQTAFGLNHPVLILSPFGHEEDNNPVTDIIKIYNFCILKYGHKFQNIIIAIPPYYPKQIFDLYNDNIIKPNELVKQIDIKYDGLLVQRKIKETLIPTNESESDDIIEMNDKKQNASNSSSELMSEEREKLKLFAKMMKKQRK